MSIGGREYVRHELRRWRARRHREEFYWDTVGFTQWELYKISPIRILFCFALHPNVGFPIGNPIGFQQVFKEFF